MACQIATAEAADLGFLGSGGETRTHNVRINRPITLAPLTSQTTSNNPLSRAFMCSPVRTTLQQYSPKRVLSASWWRSTEPSDH